MKKLHCAVLGCGRIGCGFDDNSKGNKILTHAGAYDKNSNTLLVALCDIDESKLRKYGEKYKVSNLYKTSKKMFDNMELDLISICTLADTHLALVKDAAKSGIKGIFLEKPFSNNLSDAKKIIEICNYHKIQLIVDHQRRFDQFFFKLKKILNGNKIGHIQFVNIFYGAGITNTGTHVFDLLRFLFGEIKNVQGKFSINKSSNPHDPNLDVEIEFRNKIYAKLNAIDVSNYGLLEMDIFGTNGRIKINLTNNELTYYRISNKNKLVYRQLKKSKIRIKQSKKSSIMLGLDNLINCVNKKQNPMCSGKDGYKALELSIASFLSAKNKKKISLPLKNQKYKIISR